MSKERPRKPIRIRKERDLLRSDDGSIALTINLPKNVGGINTLAEVCMFIARELIVRVVELFDEELLNEKPKGWRCIGKRKRTTCTLIGEITISRRLYVKATKGKKQKGRFLLDEALNIRPQRRVTHGLLKLMVAAATRLPFREVSKMLEEAGFPAVSHATVHKEVRRYGLLQKEQLEHMRDTLFLAGKDVGEEAERKHLPILFVKADGVVVKCQGAAQKNFEGKVGVVYEGWEKTQESADYGWDVW